MAAASLAASAALRPLTYVVGVDGSEACKRAFNVAAAMVKKGDRLVVVHIADASKDFLPFDLRAPSIEAFFSMRCTPLLPSGSWQVLTRFKRPGEHTKHALMAFLHDAEVNADVLFVGFTGRKGPKDDITLIGSNADYSLREAGRTSIIVKTPEVPATAVFVVGVDGSARAHSGFELVQHFARAEDEIDVLHVEDLTARAHDKHEMDADAVEAKYHAIVAAAAAGGRRVTFTRLAKRTESHIADVITDFCVDRGATYVCIGADGMGAFMRGAGQKLGSNSDRVVRTARCSVIVAQAKNAVYADSPIVRADAAAASR